jgi:hypothetical protein
VAGAGPHAAALDGVAGVTPRRIGAAEARAYWAHPSQQIMGATPDALPDAPAFQYWACGPVCGVFHPALWPGVWMAHHAALPEGRGRLVEPARAGLVAFWEAERPARIIGWTAEANRLAVAFARRLGFEVDGVLDLPAGRVLMQGWKR